MSTASGSAAVPSLKKFVTENEIEEKRRKRQEEWEKVRQPNQPLEAPDEPVETRSLFEQLQAQKDMKQLEFDEAHKLKNQVHGLDEEEAEFLEYVTDRQQEVEKERHLEELNVLQEFRNSVSSRVTSSEVPSVVKATENTKQSSVAGKKRNSQAALLAGAVKRNRSDSADKATSSVSDHTASTAVDQSAPPSGDTVAPPISTSEVAPPASGGGGGVARVVGVLPGLGVYSDSDESDTSSSDSEIDTDIFRRESQGKAQDGGGGHKRS